MSAVTVYFEHGVFIAEMSVLKCSRDSRLAGIAKSPSQPMALDLLDVEETAPCRSGIRILVPVSVFLKVTRI